MKRIIFAVALSLAFATSAFAGEPIAGPTIPSDLETAWEKNAELSCTPKEGLVLSLRSYAKALTGENAGLYEVFSLTKKNGEDANTVTSVVFPGLGMLEGTLEAKGADGKWTKYSVEDADALKAYYDSLGVTEEMLERCNNQ